MNHWQRYWQQRKETFKTECLSARKTFLEDLKQPLPTQQQVLRDIIEHCADSDFGQHHHFNQLKSIEDFQTAVPIRRYEQFSPWLEKEVEQGGGVLSGSPLLRWLRTSGSTGNSKKIPYTQYWLENYRVPALRILWANYFQQAPDILDNPFATLDTQSIKEPTVDFLNGIPYQGITNRNQILTDQDWNPPWFHAPWFNEEVPDGYETRMYYRLRYFISQDLRAILSINPSTLIALHKSLETNFEKLITEVRDGTLQGKAILRPDPACAERLQQLYDKGNYTFNDLWPNLKMIACWTSAAAALYLPQLKQLFPRAKILPFMTCGTEGIVTLPIDDHFISGPLAINQGFYEFLPADTDLDGIINQGTPVKALLFNQLEEGQEYHLIMTQGSGMCRYAVGDIYKVIGFYNGVPRLAFSQRQGTYYSFTGEKLTEPQMLSMIHDVTKDCEVSNGLFLCCPVWDKKPYYHVLLEADGANDATLFSTVEKKMDLYLQQINEEYLSKRKSKRLAAVKLSVIQKGIIQAFQEREKATGNALQYKYKPFQKDDSMFQAIIRSTANQ
jgi:hypothetical protein